MRALAAFLSLLVPGTGQALCGRIARAVIWAVCAVATFAVAPFVGVLGLVAHVAIRALAAVDAAVTGAGPRRSAGAAGIVAGAQVAAVVVVVTVSYEAFKIPSSGMEPTISIGDHLVINKLAYAFAAPARGDVIVFDNPCTPSKKFIKRVVGLPGDTVEVRCSTLYVNGTAVPSELVTENASYEDLDEGRSMTVHYARYRERLGGATYDTAQDPERAASEAPMPDPHDFPEIDEPDSRFARGPRLPSCGIGSEGTGTIEGAATPEHPCDPQLHYVVPPRTVFVMGDNRSNSSDSRVWGPVPVGMITGKYLFTWW